MAKHIFTFRCPCCHKRIELNTRSHKARAVRVEEAAGAKDLDSLVADQKHEGKRLESVFDEAREDHEKQDQRLADLFSEAKEDANKHPEERPPNIFDSD